MSLSTTLQATLPAHVRQFHSSDPDEIERILAAELSMQMRLTGSNDGYLWSLKHLDAGQVSFDLAASSGFTAVVEPGDALMVVTPERGLVTTESTAGERNTIGPGESALVALPGDSYRLDWSGDAPRARSVRIDLSLVRDVAAGSGAATTEVKFTGCRPVSPAAQRRWQEGVEHVTRGVTGVPGMPVPPLVVAESCRYLAAMALATFPNTTMTGRAGGAARGRNGDRQVDETLRLAVEFIEQNAASDIGLADIARAASVTGRAVQLAFRRRLDTTPLAYLRSVRLAHAHRELVEATPECGLTVTDVAERWGFGATSRFARRYRETFGVTPSTTLAG